MDVGDMTDDNPEINPEEEPEDAKVDEGDNERPETEVGRNVPTLKDLCLSCNGKWGSQGKLRISHQFA